jgi:small subunit ribosomal protein S4
MRIGPKYKIARRLGANVFEKTQGPKFALSEAKRSKGKGDKRPKQRTDFGNQLLEKQKVRFTYGITERQFKNYVKAVVEKKAAKPEEKLFEALESRLDNVVLRSGLVHARSLARQVVSHGHITVNGRKLTIPSYSVRIGDKIAIREGSSKNGLFATLGERLKDKNVPSWIKLDAEAKSVEVQGAPKVAPGESLFDLGAVIQFYKR